MALLIPRSGEPGMPPEARGPRLGVVAEPELQLDPVDTHPRRVQSAATEGPTETAQLASHRERGLAALDDLPRLVEAKTVYRRRRQVRLEPHFALAGRDAAGRKASGMNVLEIIELANNFQDATAGVFGNVLCVIEYPRNGGQGHSSSPRNFAHRVGHKKPLVSPP